MSEIFVGLLCCIHSSVQGTEQCFFPPSFLGCTSWNTTEGSPVCSELGLSSHCNHTPKSASLLRAEIYLRTSNKINKASKPMLRKIRCHWQRQPTLLLSAPLTVRWAAVGKGGGRAESLWRVCSSPESEPCGR